MDPETQAAHAEPRKKWNLGILNTAEDEVVPGSVLLLTSGRNDERTSEEAQEASRALKTTSDGKIVLEPQPDDSPNDPLTWASWKRNAALFSLGFYCMLGGGVTPLLAAGFQDIATTFHTPLDTVAMTTGILMLGLGIGGVIVSPTAIILGKRTVYLFTATIFLCATIWCAKANSYASMLAARFTQGMALSPIEVIPSATISELFYLHEKAFRLGIYTLLLLSGKNLIPLISAVIINADGWRWVFWILAIAVAAAIVLMFFFLPETFWDRTTPIDRVVPASGTAPASIASRPTSMTATDYEKTSREVSSRTSINNDVDGNVQPLPTIEEQKPPRPLSVRAENMNSPLELNPASTEEENTREKELNVRHSSASSRSTSESPGITGRDQQEEASSPSKKDGDISYTEFWRAAPLKTYMQSLTIYHGRLRSVNWFIAAARPFALFTYPAVLWSAMVYALSIGWLIVLSESVSEIYRSRETYSFTSFQAGLVYLSPFIGAVFGTALAGKCSDYIVKFMARRNGGVYEPEFRLVMALPVAITTAIGLMGFGWSVEQHDAWIVPTVFFGIISFGCSLGSTTAITFVVDSYKQYAAEALVTLNFSKNIFHGFVFSLFFPHWLQSKGGKPVFIILGVIHLICMVLTIPMYIYGKRARSWTSRTGLVERIGRRSA